MARMTERLKGRTKEAARKALEKVESKVLVAEGRKSVKRKARVVTKVAKKAMKAGAITGALMAAAVVVREVKKRRQMG